MQITPLTHNTLLLFSSSDVNLLRMARLPTTTLRARATLRSWSSSSVGTFALTPGRADESDTAGRLEHTDMNTMQRAERQSFAMDLS